MQRLSELVAVFSPETMITALYGIVEPASGSWTYAVAGHYPPVLRTADGRSTIEECEPGAPLGLGRDYDVHHGQLEQGSTLVLYTDGLLERRGESIEVGLDRLLEACAAGPDEPDPLCAFLMRELLCDVNDDDAAVVAVRRS
jgi:serine phosphatase RsbU (regulator of sigma subunit)